MSEASAAAKEPEAIEELKGEGGSKEEKSKLLDLEGIWSEHAEEHVLSEFEYLQLFLSYALTSIRRNIPSSFATVFVTALALFLSGSILLATKPLGELLFSADNLFPIKVFLASEKKELVGAIIEKQPGLGEVRFVSGADALEALIAQLGENHPLFEGLDRKDSVLPDRYLIEVAPDADKEQVFESIKKALLRIPEVERVSLQSELIRQFQKGTELFSSVGRLFAFAALVGAMLLVIIAVQLRFLLRAEEVGVMRLVGATKPFIVTPLYIEAILSGILASVFALLSLGWLEGKLFTEVTVLFPDLIHRPDAFALSFFVKGLLALSAIVVTGFGTWCSIELFQRER